MLARLVRHGLVEVTAAGSSDLYLLNRDHVAVAALVDLRGQLFARVADTVWSWPRPPVAAAVFGSAARGDGNIDSDIDLFLVRPARMGRAALDGWDSDVAERARMIRRWSGKPGGDHGSGPGQVRDLLASGAQVAASLRREAVSLLGDAHVLHVAGSRWTGPAPGRRQGGSVTGVCMGCLVGEVDAWGGGR